MLWMAVLIGTFYWAVMKYADIVFVTSLPDVKRFPDKRVIVIRGGVETPTYIPVPYKEKIYDAVYFGRFHLQKGLMELIDIWEMVLRKKPDAMLALIGCGGLEEDMRYEIFLRGLEPNIEFLGYKEGGEAYEVFKNSRVVVHPATYDSGGMAPAQVMAFGCPLVSFNLPAFETYYPKGRLGSKDKKAFSQNILKLLNNRKFYNKMSKEAKEFAMRWSWERRADVLYKSLH